MVKAEVISQQYPAVMWRFSLVTEECGIVQLSALSLLHTHSVSLHLCFGESFDKEDGFWNSQLSLFGWLELRTLLLKESACLLCLHFFVWNSQGRFFSFHLLVVLLYINHLLFIKKFFWLHGGLWDLVPWSGIVSRPPSVEAWSPKSTWPPGNSPIYANY